MVLKIVAGWDDSCAAPASSIILDVLQIIRGRKGALELTDGPLPGL